MKFSVSRGDEGGCASAFAAVHHERDSIPLDIEQLYEDHSRFLLRVIERLVEPHHVDDILQETFLIAFQKRTEFEGRSAVRTWLYSIAGNLCRRHNRGAHRLRLFRERFAVAEVSPTPERPDIAIARTQAVERACAALRKLPFAQREVFVLYELEGLQGPVISDMLSVPLGTVWTRLHHARKKFQSLLRTSEAGQ